MAERKSNNPTAITIIPGIVSRVIRGVNYILGRTGEAEIDFFGPQQPIQPAAPENVQGRQFDYPVGYNLWIRPREGEAITFEQMRMLADACTVLRLAIETRKDQLVKLKWSIKPKDDKITKADDPRIQELTEFWLSPDREHSWQQWLRMIAEDMLVIDATTLYPRSTVGGDIWGYEPVDGTTIKRVIDYSGRTPIPPEPAYEQILKGLPAIWYTKDELVYYPRNIRTNKIYGFSPVEQVILTVNIILRRDISQLQYYTEGNIPDAFGFLPPEWSPDQIRQFQEYWDSIMEGDTAQRRHMKWLPGGSGAKVEQLRDPKLKDEYDEWLARIICYAFSLPPTPFVRQMNRATAETVQDSALEEGLAPMMQWIADLINFCIFKYHQITDLEFAWLEEDEVDQEKQATILDKKVKNGTLTPDEARAVDGRAPYVDGIGAKPLIFTGQGVVLLETVIEPPEPPVTEPVTKPAPGIKEPKDNGGSGGNGKTAPKATEKLIKAKKKVMRIINPNRKSAIKAVRALKKAYFKFFKSEGPKITATLGKAIKKFTKVDEDEIDKILSEIDFSSWSALVPATADQLEKIHKEAAQHGIDNLFESEPSLTITQDELIGLVDDAAVKFARERAAELVGMKWVDGELVENPNAAWAITDSTRDTLHSMVTDAVENGWSPQELSDRIEESGLFDEDRAELIARTEIKNADNNGNMDSYRESGLDLEKSWVVSADHDQDDECDDNESEGWIDIDDLFPSGDDAPGAHPRCMCSLEVRTKEEE